MGGPRAEALAKNALLTLASRGLMALTPIVCAVFGWIIVSYIDGQNAAIADAGSRYESLKTTVIEIDKRVSNIEVARSQEVASADRSRSEVSTKLDKLTDSISAQGSQIAALTATVNALRDQVASQRFGSVR